VNQKRIWFGTQYMKDPCHGNMALLYEAIGKGFDVKRFQSALDKVVQRHPQLRTAFFQEAKTGELLQGQLAASRGLSTLHSLQTDADEEEGLVHRVYRQQASHVWRLAEGEVVRTTIVSRPSTGQHWVIFGFHHLVMDGMSWKIFLQDLDCAYRQQPFRRMPGHYMDYAADVNDRVPSAQELAYWAQELQDFSPDPMPLLPWARVRSRKVTDNYEARMHQRRLDPDLVHRVTKTSRLLHGSPAHFYLAAMQIVLARVLGLRQLWVGMVDANRRDDRFRDTLGCFLNDLPLRLELNTDEPFADVFKRVSRTILRALQNSHAPLEVILDRFQVPRSPIHAPLFQVVFNYRMNDYLDAPLGDDARLQYVDWVQVGNAYDMGIALGQSDNNQCVLEVAYRDYLYTREDMDLFMDLYVNVLEAFADHPASAIQDGRLYSPAQVDRAIQTGLGPQGDVSWQPATLPARFDTMAAAYADDVAVIDDSGSFTYAQLVDRIQQIARGIMAHGPIRPGARIAVRCWPSVDVVAAMFAIQRLGAVYVPLDMSLPAARHQAILADCQPALLCCHDRSGLAEISLPESSWQVYDLTTVPWPESGPSLGHDAIPDQSMASSAACLFYTSGSTGTPKGILLAHAGLVNTLAAKARDFPLHRATVLQQSSLGFDMALSQMACALLNGGTVVMVPQHARGDPAAITRLMRQHSVQVTMATPSEYLLQLEYHRDVLRQCAAWHLACVGGEPLSEPCRQRFHALRGPRLANFYGPTETSLVCTWRWVDLENDDAERTTAADGDDAGTNVGRPSANTALYIVDADLRLLPVGMPGEVCIAGPGVALGYLDASLSQVRFLEDPWANRRRGGSAGEPSPRLFRTGDRGRLLPDGSLILLGRLGTDNMVKVRGLRIDLDEIATAMLHAAPERISAAVVSVRGEGDARYLVAHVALRPGSVTPDHLDTEADWQELVRGLPLPSYMRPSRIIPLEQLPMDSNRKIDRRAIAAMPLPPLLPSSATSKTSNAVPPRLTLAEGGLRLLWQQILQHPDQPPLEIGPSSDFFVLGGNSNQLVRLQATIERSMACSVPLPRLYSASTLRLMAATIATCQDAANEPASRAMKDDDDDDDDDEGTIDWAAETTLPTLPPMDRKTSLVPKAGAHEILFTGASAFLGMAMVRALAEDPRVSRIHCIAVADETASSTLHTIPKVVVYEGTLRHDTLGLTDSQLAQLRAQIDLIIHTGAEGTCVNLYSSLRAANVRPAKWLASLATSLSIPIHYVSHSRVIDFTGRSSFPPASLASYPPPTHDRDGYTPCKWASECIIENWARQTGLPACIHRPCILVGDGAPIDGAIIQYSQRLRASPLFPNFRGRIDVRHVTGVASDIAQACLSTAPALSSPDDRKDSPNITYRHYSSGRSFPASDYRAYIEHLAGEPVVEVSLAEWTKRAMEIGMGVESARFMDWSIKVGKMMTFNYMGEQEL
jgi:aspyridone synthetase (hybrid polyketide synthase/nonribosomal peptide synthetase)/cyclopiazonic acid synthetase (hybrid polyketide synthase/nonribosomal peptide synthetase)